MSEQREKPGITPEQLNVTVGLSADAPTLVSGGQIENFREGWAMDIMRVGTIAHYFKREGEFDTAKSLCSFIGKTRWLYGPGNFSKCQHCTRKLMHRRSNQVVRHD